MKNPLRNLGPGTLIAAAFIGPGTVTVCTLAGVTYGFTLLWAMALSIIATIVLQEMAARLGLVTGKGLAEVVKSEIDNPPLKYGAIVLILSAILIGNAAYESGNISGGVLGIQTWVDSTSVSIGEFMLNWGSISIGVLAFLLLYFGNYKTLEKSLITLVLFMSASFLIAAIITSPNMIEVLKGIFVPVLPEEGILTVVALVGTTVVPYNLFLHASVVRERWDGVSDLPAARKDLYISIILGGLVSMAIIICAASMKAETVANARDLAKGLEPLYGSVSRYIFGIGLFAAGITSAITAPLAAAYVVSQSFGWNKNTKSRGFRAVWMLVLLLGVIISSVGLKPIEIIRFAQAANGLLLPIIAIFLIWACNRGRLLGVHRNSLLQNFISLFILLCTLILSVRSLEKVFEFQLLG